MRVKDAGARMRLQLLSLATAAIAVSLTAGSCDYPSVSVLWAPNGQRALVSVDNPQTETMLIDSRGNVLGHIATSNDESFTWMPDSLHLLMTRKTTPRTWSDYAHVIGSVRARAIIREADILAVYIRGYRGDWRTFGVYAPVKALREHWTSSGTTDEQIHYYLAQTQPQLIAPLVNAAQAAIKEGRRIHGMPKWWGKLLFDPFLASPPIYELILRDAGGPPTGPEQILLRVPNDIDATLPSPTGRALAIGLEGMNSSNLGTIVLIPTGANAMPVEIAGEASPVAWSPDGQDLAYYWSATDDKRSSEAQGLEIPMTFVISRRRVCTLGGDILATPGDAQNLAEGQEGGWGFFLPSPWLQDGRLVFQSSLLPSNPKEKTNALFAVRTQATPIVEQILTPSLWSRLNGDYQTPIVVSKDGKRAAMLGKHGAVTVVYLDTGEVRVLQGDIPGVDDDGTVPAWRADDALTYVVGPGDPAGSPDRRELVIDDLQGNKHAISRSWQGVYFLATPPPSSPLPSPTP